MALVGQPNCGKSTVFNMLTGARQYVANYPGVTVDVKKGKFRVGEKTVEVVDLPGTYSLTSYSAEEMVTRDYVLNEAPDLVLNVADTSNLKRSLYLTFQLLEMGAPLIVNLNMTDVAEGHGLLVDGRALAAELGVPVVETVANRNRGDEAVRKAISEGERRSSSFRVDYGSLEPFLEKAEKSLRALFPGKSYPWRWIAVKLFEEDEAVRRTIVDAGEPGLALLEEVDTLATSFEMAEGSDSRSHIGLARHTCATALEQRVSRRTRPSGKTWTDRIDAVAVNRFLGPLLLLGIIYALYELSIVQGYKLTEYLVPWLNRLRIAIEGTLPPSGFLEEPLLREFTLDLVTAVNSMLIYVPIFLVLFAAIAVLEDVGYMPRMAFILDRLFRRFGLHGQSTLPLILGGVFVGGCAVPGVMATRVIADERARLATILVVPLMNCLAKVPLYTLLLGIYFADTAGAMMVFISTITLIAALGVAKVLTLTVLRNRPSSPFVMEMPPYHLPTLRGIVIRSLERTWLFLRKIATVIVVVAAGVFVLTHYPSPSPEVLQGLAIRADEAKVTFLAAVAETPFAASLADDGTLDRYLNLQESLRQFRMLGTAKATIDERLTAEAPDVAPLVIGSDPAVKTLDRAFRTLRGTRLELQRELSSERLNASVLGRMGQAMEPMTRPAGFTWKVNVALLSSLAAKESSVATLGVLYRPQGDDANKTLGERMQEQERGFTPLHALALMVFMAFYPPCIATILMVKVESRRWKWALLALGYPILLGFACAALVFTGGSALGLSGTRAALVFYGVLLFVTFLLGLIPGRAPETEKASKRIASVAEQEESPR